MSNYKKSGLRIVGTRGHREVKDCIIRFAKWLRKKKEFPVRITVYLSADAYVTARDGEKCVGLIWIPDALDKYPYIRLATGDYESRKGMYGRENALAGDLCTLCHELLHYWQWIETNNMWEKGIAREARNLVNRYANEVDVP